MRITRPSLRRPYAIMVTPLRSKDSAFGEREAAAAIFISDRSGNWRTVLRSSVGSTV